MVKARQNLPERVVVADSPAVFVRNQEERDIEFWTWGKQLYVDLAGQYKREGLDMNCCLGYLYAVKNKVCK